MIDTISRREAIKEIARWTGYLDEDMITRIQTGLRKLPPAQPERKKGKWIPHKEISREYVGAASIITIKHDYWFCDLCDYRAEEGRSMYNFCPYCGAEMMNGGYGHANADA